MLCFPFALFHEVWGSTEHFRLMKFDPENITLQVVQSFEYIGDYFVFIDQFNPSKFVLKRNDTEVHICKLASGKVYIGEAVDLEWNSNDDYTSYFNDHLHSVRFNWDENEDGPEVNYSFFSHNIFDFRWKS